MKHQNSNPSLRNVRQVFAAVLMLGTAFYAPLAKADCLVVLELSPTSNTSMSCADYSQLLMSSAALMVAALPAVIVSTGTPTNPSAPAVPAPVVPAPVGTGCDQGTPWTDGIGM